MKSRILSALFSLLLIGIISAQSDLYIPKEIQKGYKNQTRSKDGNPGKKYWQNNVDYKIDVTVTPLTRNIDGKEKVIFKNNSPDDLSEVVIRLYHDVFKKGNKRDSKVNPSDIGEGVNVKKVLVNGIEYDVGSSDKIERLGTNLIVKLMNPLKSGESLDMEFEWEQKIPLTLSRTGAIDETTFFIGYWYPQVAVYDDVFGWDKLDYTMDTEFYNNLANFDVNITVPNNFLVWATGTLENSEKILPDQIHKKYLEAKYSKKVIEVVNEEDIKDLNLKSNTWNFRAIEVTDFAFALSDHYLWHATSQEVSGNNILINSAFPVGEGEKYKDVTSIQQKAMKYFSEDIPGIPYPYPVFSTFIGLKNAASGMEFPMMANNGGPGIPVTVHELFHMYFPMYVRVNERRFAWMDEGWADFMENMIIYKFFQKPKKNSSFYSNFKITMQGVIGSIGDLPAITPSQYTGDSYGYHAYSLPSFTYALLYQHLGEKKFLKCFSEYINRWAKKSPTPYDFFYTFEDVSGQDLSFIWESWYFKMGYPDLAIQSFENGNLKIKKIGERIIPIQVHVDYQNTEQDKNEVYDTIINPSVWSNTNSYILTIPKPKKIKNISINEEFPDFNEVDNFFPTLNNRYKELKVDKNIIGTYFVERYGGMFVIVSEENGGLRIHSDTFTWIDSFLIPKNETSFSSTDKVISINYKKSNNGKDTIELDLPKYNLKFTGKKRN